MHVSNGKGIILLKFMETLYINKDLSLHKLNLIYNELVYYIYLSNMKHRVKLYQSIVENLVGKNNCQEAFKKQQQACNTLRAFINGDKIVDDQFPLPLDVEPFASGGLIIGELALAALAIANGDILTDILYNNTDLEKIQYRLTRPDRLMGEVPEDEFEDEICGEELSEV
ncbi:hypothetical protein SS50377_22492 [Spironucleus salmonicida]|uniref:Uncharacterized protein n=1 Tax=Spironucleus salmonicida TaxID=348837 RepID=A0A9P8RZD1_9EUKA|nr:hypothetical protein SS50377_22492 [Spironucleus salmonicida]